jgi:hypothetical protein
MDKQATKRGEHEREFWKGDTERGGIMAIL